MTGVDWLRRIGLIALLVLMGFALFALSTLAHAITLTWTDTSDNETYFAIDRCQVSDNAVECMPFYFLAQTVANVQSWIDDTGAPKTKYCYRVYAANAIGQSDYSNISCSTTPAGLPAPPIAPVNLNVK